MIHVIGIDCAAQDRSAGVALGSISSGHVSVVETAVKQRSLLPTLIRWLEESDPVLIAMDAPLGWPDTLARSLVDHEAGKPMTMPANELFNRETDRIVRRHTKKRPIEVGADKIARAARRAVNLIGELREATGRPLPLAWKPGIPEEASIIEVYPATTLRSRGISDAGYKGNKPGRRERRTSLVGELEEIRVPAHERDGLIRSDDALDAAICLLAAADFCEGAVLEPTNLDRAEKEGWIWFRPEDVNGHPGPARSADAER